MPGKPKSRNWNDVQTAIATVAIVTTLGLWNLFAAPSKAVKAAETSEPILPPPPTELPIEDEAVPTAMPQVKIMFTPGVTPVVQEQVQQVQQPVKKKKKNKDKDNNNSNNNNSGSVSVTQTKTS